MKVFFVLCCRDAEKSVVYGEHISQIVSLLLPGDIDIPEAIRTEVDSGAVDGPLQEPTAIPWHD